ncbi:hypothetical protein F7734_58950 [Scytonema sp. UIC 10036]|uniref:hypothetical protein n=1 Tax=Scytonema sp. UIC 10036 TaxID=2304196 RepID=UPI0012DA5A4F|nr:hypothetical protein [Scytonema sp. UIC 10036]MUH01621.1 hypothetical protein [Scytonema sp. UIC 10036]
MSKKLLSRSTTPFSFYCLSLLLGGWVAILVPLASAKAQFDVPVPPPPPENYQEYSAPEGLDRRYPDRGECYRILVDKNNGLNRVRRVVRDAFIYRGFIQAGYECGEPRMRRRVDRLVSNGIGGIRVYQISNGQIVGRPYPDRPYPDRPLSRRCRVYGDKCYYVVVPAISQNLLSLERQIKGLVRYGEPVEARNEPRGEHVRVGPFEERSQAEILNRHLRNRGNLSNARVYYGK